MIKEDPDPNLTKVTGAKKTAGGSNLFPTSNIIGWTRGSDCNGRKSETLKITEDSRRVTFHVSTESIRGIQKAPVHYRLI